MEQLKVTNSSNEFPSLSKLGLGTMRMVGNKEEGIKAIHKALDSGINFLNTGDFYGAGESESIVGQALTGRKRDEAFVSVKFGGLLKADGGMYGIDPRPEFIENYLVYSLKRLGLDYIDLYEPGRISPHIPVEETIGVMSDLVKKGYIKSIGVTEVDADTLRRAHATHPISLVEMSYSLMNRNIENDLLPTARELGIGVVAFGVLISGLIGGSNAERKMAFIKQMVPASVADNFSRNLSLSEALEQIAKEKDISLAQLAIAWVMAQGEDILTLVGSRTEVQLEDTLKALDVRLTKEDLDRIESIIPKELAFSSYMPPLNIHPNGLFKH
ncbi:aldo/keto reductase [Sphingobacterium sp. UBA5670]|uniref:aldo/keto reductase n=1 Tax=Sphingobacterium sp. UBA5670 TaxID=1947502 RepID=UPI0025EA6D6C|nr:aldo/keto reductase [Sphingobacterium sp. UBA5670]